MDKYHLQRQRLLDLACVVRQLDPCPDPDDAEEDNKDTAPVEGLSSDAIAQQDLLNALAFIASTEKTAEQVAAVGLDVDESQDLLRFSVAMNAVVPQRVIDGLQELCELLRRSESAVEIEQIFIHILNLKRTALKTLLWGKKPPGIQHSLDEACSVELNPEDIAFGSTLQISTEERQSTGRYTDSTHSDHMKSAITRLHNVRASCRKAIEELKGSATDSSGGELDAVVAFCMGAFELRHHQCFRYLLVTSGKVPHGRRLHRQLRKLSLYRQSVLDLCKTVRLLKRPSRVEVERVPTTAPLQLPPSKETFRSVLLSAGLQLDGNMSARERGFRELRKKPLHVHAEVELVTFYTTRGRKHGPYIGCSKLACFLCNMFLKSHPEFRVRGTHRKIYTGWTIPNIPNTPRATNTVMAAMCDELQHMVRSLGLRTVAPKQMPPESISGVSETVLTTARPREKGEGIPKSVFMEHLRGWWNKNVSNTTENDGDTDDGDFSQTEVPDMDDEDYVPQPPRAPTGPLVCECEEEREATIPCPGCHNVWYCSTECMKEYEFLHIFKCGGVEVTSADYLIRACYEDRFPEGDAAEDFGFNNCGSPHDRAYLCGLYVGLVKFKGIGREDLHEWQVKDILAEKICEVYEPHRIKSPQTVGDYYPWFLNNKHLVSSASSKQDGEGAVVTIVRRNAQSYLPLADRGIPLSQLPESKRNVCTLYGLLKSGWNPHPNDDLWREFGFWACRGKMSVSSDSPFYYPDMLPSSMRGWFTGCVVVDEEHLLARFYLKLFDKTSFFKFHQAYLDGSLDKLTERVGLGTEARFWKQEREAILGLKPNKPYPSAYDLKQHIVSETVTEPINSVQVDYGYLNCRNPLEREQWRGIYSKVFRADRFRFDGLHNACIKGKIYEYVKDICPDTPTIFKRLSKNVYPLSD